MRPISAIVVHKDPVPADALANALRQHFRFVSTAGSYEEAYVQQQRHRAQLLILDLETIGPETVRRLRREIPAATIFCTQRVIDEQLWAEALRAGAADCCHESDVRSIVLAALRDKPQLAVSIAIAS